MTSPRASSPRATARAWGRVIGRAGLLLLPGWSCATPLASRQRPATREPELRWATSSSLPVSLDHHATFITNAGGHATLWVAGGNDYARIRREVWQHALSQDGEPRGTWQSGSALPYALAGAGVAVASGWVYLAGGQDSSLHKRSDVLGGPVLPDGQLGPWTEREPLPAPRFHSTLTAAGHWLYSVGGLEARESTRTVFRAELHDDGSLSPWVRLGDLPRARSHHAALVMAGRLCILGGLDGDPARQNVPLADLSCAAIGSDGSLAEWQAAGELPASLATHAATVVGDDIWVFGGVENNATVTGGVWWAPVAAVIPLASWRSAPSLPAPRSHVHQVPTFSGHVYSVGGGNRRVTSNAFATGQIVSHR